MNNTITPKLLICLFLTTAMLKVQDVQVYSQTVETRQLQAQRNPASFNRVTGTITYRQRIALPPGAVIKVVLLDISLQDVAAKTLSEQTIQTTGEQVPIPFKLPFNPAEIKEGHSYAVRATIKIKDRLAFTTDRVYSVITRGNPLNVNLVLVPVVNSQNLDKLLQEGEWLLEDLGGKGVMDRLQTTLKFGTDNQLGGSGGCNRYFASYQLNGSQIKVGVIGATKMACPPAIMNQETRYFQALQKANRIVLNNDFLFIYSEGLEKPLKFIRRKS